MIIHADFLNHGQLTLTPKAKSTFRGGRAVKAPLYVGHSLYKYTKHPLYSSRGITPFWSSVGPVTPDDPGLATLQKRAQAVQAGNSQFARARSAVTRQWNTMTYLLVARLTLPVYAFVGQTAGQFLERDEEQEKGQRADTNVFLIGGAWQVWIPNLTEKHIVQVSRTPATGL